MHIKFGIHSAWLWSLVLNYMKIQVVFTNASHALECSLIVDGQSTCQFFFFFLKIFFFFLMWSIFKVFIEFVTVLLLFYVLVFWPRGMWDPSFPTRDRTCTPCIGRRGLNHWTAREVPTCQFLSG